MSKYFGLDEVAQFWEGVVTLNNWHQHRISKIVVKNLFGSVTGKKLYILGFSFKANTNDTRESASITICKDLLEEGAILCIHDPKVEPNQIIKDLGSKETKAISEIQNFNNSFLEGKWCFSKNIYDGFEYSDAALVLTEWDEFSKIDWLKASKKMRKPSWVFDARSITNSKKVIEAKLNLWKIGDGSEDT